jgi:hypothetical protein
MAARRYLRDDPNLLFMKPGAPAACAREYLNLLRGPGASIVSCDHSKPSGLQALRSPPHSEGDVRTPVTPACTREAA